MSPERRPERRKMVSKGIKGKRQKTKAIHAVLILVLVIFCLVAFYSSNEKIY
jgi:hypothetical protein